jgi:predicted TIM-barrel fold metal-dependent hydrolase
VRKIDAFAHILPPSYARRLESIMSGSNVSDRILWYQQWIHEDPALVDLDARWRTIEPFDDYVQVLTLAVPPLDQLGDPAVSRDLARAVNDELAELVASYPDRFAGFAAALPLNDVDAAVGELTRAMGELGALGAQLHTNVGGAPLDSPRFEPVFETVTRLGGALWVHPTRSAVWADYPVEDRSEYGLWWSLGCRTSPGGWRRRSRIPSATSSRRACPRSPSTTSGGSSPTRRCSAPGTRSGARWSSSAPVTCCSAPTCRSGVPGSSRTRSPT